MTDTPEAKIGAVADVIEFTPAITKPKKKPEVDVSALRDCVVSEDRVALEFTAQHADRLRFDHHAGAWFRWTGAIWQRDETKLAFSWARQAARQLAASTDEERTHLSAGKAAFAAGVERFAQADPTLAVTSEIWDRDPWLLGTPQGVVDLQTGLLREARSGDFITKRTSVAPAATADCPRWIEFLQQATAGDEQLIGFLRRWCGYCLTGETTEHALMFVFGPGGNGKGVMLNTLAGILGSYATNAAMETFTASTFDRPSNDLAMLAGARLVMTTETEEGRAWAEQRIKALTGGDPITARFLRREFFTFTPTFKLMVSGNHKPALRNVDDAARRRFNIVPFNNRPNAPDPQLAAKLRAEWPGILRWMIEGCLEWQAKRLDRPDVVQAATAEYFSEQDILRQWIEDECETGKRAYSDTTEALFRAWSAYALAAGEKPGTARWFAQALQRQGFRQIKDTPGHRNKRGFEAIRVRLKDVSDQWQNQSERER